jgi:eukaryotic-like serine/threonine-protein kinase
VEVPSALVGRAPVQVGRYEILEVIGVGANSRVARAHDPMIGRLVAIKLLSPEFAEGEARQRFLQEARVVGQLSHPAIITLHDMGIEESSSTAYLVMEFLKGQALDRILEKGSLPMSKACAWVAEVATALGAAHRKGVIHGDIKPANILITEDNRVKLMDFGMARLTARETAGTALSGTPAYWCPEQIMGKPQDARSDLFSLGVVLHELLTGHRPFDADTLQGICNRVLSSTPLPPSHSNPSLPAALDQLVAHLLAKDPSTRYSSADTLANDLYPFARRKTAPEAPAQRLTPQPLSFGSRAAKLLRSA